MNIYSKNKTVAMPLPLLDSNESPISTVVLSLAVGSDSSLQELVLLVRPSEDDILSFYDHWDKSVLYLHIEQCFKL
jgi:hypothetical protein